MSQHLMGFKTNRVMCLGCGWWHLARTPEIGKKLFQEHAPNPTAQQFWEDVEKATKPIADRMFPKDPTETAQHIISAINDYEHKVYGQVNDRKEKVQLEEFIRNKLERDNG